MLEGCGWFPGCCYAVLCGIRTYCVWLVSLLQFERMQFFPGCFYHPSCENPVCGVNAALFLSLMSVGQIVQDEIHAQVYHLVQIQSLCSDISTSHFMFKLH